MPMTAPSIGNRVDVRRDRSCTHISEVNESVLFTSRFASTRPPSGETRISEKARVGPEMGCG